MKIKICGITKTEEANYLNDNNIDYAGFVFFEKSKRNITVEKAREIFDRLNPTISKVAVMVSPDVNIINKLQNESFDILQIHKDLSIEVLECAKLPIWYAVNISDTLEAKKKIRWIEELPVELSEKIEAIVVDAPDFGSGKTFNWRKSKRLLKAGAQSPPLESADDCKNDELSDDEISIGNRMFILAGGLKPENVAEGIKLFKPDIVDVSSGVEGLNGKDEELVKSFAYEVRNVVE